MKYLSLAIAIVCLSLCVTPAWSQDGHWYASFKGGIGGGPSADVAYPGTSGLTLDTETGFALMGSVGYAFKNFRVEAEFSARRNDVDSASFNDSQLRFTSTGSNHAPADGRLRTFSYMVNGIYAIEMSPLLRPYLLAGVGMAQVNGELVSIGDEPVPVDDDETVFAYQAGVGAEYPLSRDFAFDVSYRFFGTSTVTFDDVDVTNTHHAGLVGLTMRF